jgi:hypothetical protein
MASPVLTCWKEQALSLLKKSRIPLFLISNNLAIPGILNQSDQLPLGFDHTIGAMRIAAAIIAVNQSDQLPLGFDHSLLRYWGMSFLRRFETEITTF